MICHVTVRTAKLAETAEFYRWLPVFRTLQTPTGEIVFKEAPHSPVLSPSPGTRFAYFTDLNGCGIQLFEEKRA